MKDTAESISRDIKSNAEKISSTITDKAKSISKEIKPVTDAVSDSVRKTTREISKTIINLTDTMADEIKNSTTKAHKVIMLGGQRAGKSSILACVVDQLSNNTPGDICSAVQVDQAHIFYNAEGKAYTMPTLSEKKIEVKRFATRHKVSNNLFAVDMSQSSEKGSYYVQISTGENAQMTLEFVDVPGEAMIVGSSTRSFLESQAADSDIYIIAIDTPFLMEADEDVNILYNRREEITSVICDMMKPDIENECDKRLIIFCPVKCEKWLNAKQGDLVTEKVCKVYRTLINSFVKNPNVSMWVMPVETAGGIEFSKFMDAKLVFKTADDTQGEECSVNEITGTIFYRDGTTERIRDSYVFEPHKEFTRKYKIKIPGLEIPRSWYKSNGKAFTPRLCEQPVYHMLRFLGEKDKKINEIRLKKDKDVSWWEKLKRFFTGYVSPFGKYADDFQNMLKLINEKNLIKESGDGFKKITTFID